jgi:hypothetical protein
MSNQRYFLMILAVQGNVFCTREVMHSLNIVYSSIFRHIPFHLNTHSFSLQQNQFTAPDSIFRLTVVLDSRFRSMPTVEDLTVIPYQ